MALRFMDSFDHYATPQIGAKWPSQGLSPGAPFTIAQGGGREAGGGALACLSDNGNPLTTANFTPEGTWIVGTAIKLTTMQSSILLLWDDGSGQTQLRLGVNASGYLQGQVASGTYVATTLPLAVGAWAYIEAELVISATVGSLTLRVNGTVVVSETGINTATGGILTATTLASPQPPGDTGWGSFGYLDDLYLCDGTGTVNNTFLGNVIVQALWPNAPGTQALWTPNPYALNFANVNDETPDDDASTNQSGTVGDIDSFLHDELRPNAGTVLGIQHVITARTATSTSHSVAALEKSGGTNYPDTGQPLQTVYTMLTFPHDTDPATGAEFTIADINAAEFGYDLTA